MEEVVDLAVDDALEQYDERERLIGEEQMRSVERAVMLQVIDGRWKDHLLDMDYLQEGIHLRALGQRDPLVEYKGEGFDLFNDMLESVKTSTVTTLMKNSPEDLAMFTAITLDEPVMALNYTSGDDLDQPDVVHRRRDGRRRVPAGRRPRRRAAAQRGGRRRRARRDDDEHGAGAGAAAHRLRQGRAQRPVPVREREEVQEVSRGLSRLRRS